MSDTPPETLNGIAVSVTREGMTVVIAFGNGLQASFDIKEAGKLARALEATLEPGGDIPA